MYLLMAIMNLGFPAFPMSPRNSAEATAELLKQTGAVQMFTNTDGPIHALAKETAALLSKDGVKLDIFPMVKYDDLIRAEDAVETKRMPRVGNDDIVLILHSSGSILRPMLLVKTETDARLHRDHCIPQAHQDLEEGTH